MSEKKRAYWQQLDQWTEDQILTPSANAWLAANEMNSGGDEPAAQRHLNQVDEEIKKAIREKVLESYRNGQAAGPAKRSFKRP